MDVGREVLFGWGMANHARSRVFRPRDIEEVGEAVERARSSGLSIVHRGSGQSYGDAALNQGGATILMDRLDRIAEYDPVDGIVHAEAGVTIDRLWRHVVDDGWWPPVVPGTSRPTLGGCFAMNVHGKNHVEAGSFAEHVRSVTVLKPGGEMESLSVDDERFARHAGGMGLSGTIVALELDLVPIESGYLEVETGSAPDLRRMMRTLRVLERAHEHAVGWIDCFAGGDALGRGQVHAASRLPADHPRSGQALSVEAQEPPNRILGILPRDRAGRLLRGVAHDIGVKGVNAARYAQARLSRSSPHLETHASFHFLLDYIPGWKRAYEPDGLVQYQFFVPEDAAPKVFREALELQHERGVVSYLGVLKRHREDPYPASYSVDGYSLALDFPVRVEGLPELMALLRDFDAVQRASGGGIYAAKDAMSGLGELPEQRRPEYSSNLVRRWSRAG